MYPGSICRLLIYDFTKDSWDILDTPTENYALTTYHSQLVLVGGADPGTRKATNQLWMLDEQRCWTQPLPPMEMKRYQACAVSLDNCLVVAGGCGDSPLDVVEVYDGRSWRRVQSLPRAGLWMTSALFEGNWYLGSGMGQCHEVYHTSMESLTATSKEAGKTSVWKKLLCKPLKRSTLAVLRNQLIAVGGGYDYNTAIHTYSSSNDAWVHVGDLPVACCSPCTAVLPTGELLVVGGDTQSRSFKASIRGDLDLCMCACTLI